MVCQNVQKSLKDTVLSLWWVLPSLGLFLCWMLKIEVGLNCYSVVDSELLPKLVHCCEHQLKRLVWGAEGYGWNPNLKVFWRCVDTHWTSMPAYVPVVLSATRTSYVSSLYFLHPAHCLCSTLCTSRIFGIAQMHHCFSRHTTSLLCPPTDFATLQEILTMIF